MKGNVLPIFSSNAPFFRPVACDNANEIACEPDLFRVFIVKVTGILQALAFSIGQW